MERPDGPVARRTYYARGARSETEARAIDEAAEVEGLGDEIAALRMRLREALNEEEPDMRAVVKVVEVLTRAVAAQYRISPRSRKELSDNLAAVLDSLGDRILPADRQGRFAIGNRRSVIGKRLGVRHMRRSSDAVRTPHPTRFPPEAGRPSRRCMVPERTWSSLRMTRSRAQEQGAAPTEA